jgi:hypothetical protein
MADTRFDGHIIMTIHVDPYLVDMDLGGTEFFKKKNAKILEIIYILP